MTKKTPTQPMHSVDAMAVIDAAAAATVTAHNARTAAEKAENNRLEQFEHNAAQLRELGITGIGRRGKCALADRFYDTLISAGLDEGTAGNYLSTFRRIVSGESATLNDSRNRKNSKAKDLSTLLSKLMNHAEYSNWIAGIEKQYNDAIGSLDYIFEKYLKSEGFTLKG